VAEKAKLAMNMDSYNQVLSAGILSMEAAENLIVLKTVSGVAMAVGAALDNMHIKGLMGCIAGDDTVFLAVKSRTLTDSVMSEIAKVAYLSK
jgi:transcriptional regulator of arginine metabolism